jgi:PIN domain nuclease of toxin-antitoxin system
MTPSTTHTTLLFVLDSSALIAFLFQEPGAAAVDGLLTSQGNVCLVHAVNLCEVYYDALRRYDAAIADLILQKIDEIGIQTRGDFDTAFIKKVGELKVNPGKIALGDCFALTLAIQSGATLVTSDHHEFDRIDPLGLCPILFIR